MQGSWVQSPNGFPESLVKKISTVGGFGGRVLTYIFSESLGLKYHGSYTPVLQFQLFSKAHFGNGCSAVGFLNWCPWLLQQRLPSTSLSILLSDLSIKILKIMLSQEKIIYSFKKSNNYSYMCLFLVYCKIMKVGLW